MNHGLVDMFREKLDGFTVSDYHGLDGPGLTCYLNSVLQVLFMTEDFREAVKRCCSKDSPTIDQHLGSLFADLQKKMAKTHHVANILGISNVYEQRDAAEYFEKILCLTSPEASKIFEGKLNHTTTCLKCKDRTDSMSSFWVLPIAVKDLRRRTYSVEKGLKAFFEGEKVCGDNKVYCNRCNERRDADFGCEITQTPKVLTLLLKRFRFDDTQRCYVKLRCNVDVPQTLHMENCRYDLYALVNHFGDLTGGHYTAQIKSFETHTWYYFNDDTVNWVKPPLFGAGNNSLGSCTAYLLMYRKVSRHQEKTEEGDRQALVPHHRLKDESCSVKHLNGDVLKESRDDTVRKKPPNLSWEPEEQRNRSAACVSPREETALPTETVKDIILTRNGAEPSETDDFKRGREAVAHSTGHPQRQLSMRGTVGSCYAPDVCMKSNHLRKSGKEMEHVVTVGASCKLDAKQTVRRGEITASPRVRGGAAGSRGQVRREPWR